MQSATPGKSSGKGGAHAKTQGEGTGAPVAGSRSQTTTGASEPGVRAGHSAPAPSTLTPKLPLSLGGSLSGVSGFFVESFEIPPFLLPIYQAAGTAYGIPWQVLAAINQVETDYGRDLSLSSAGAEGWMQFLPSTWARYGVDATGAGYKDPYNPADAIFAAARYLRAAGGDTNIRAAVYSYNHSQAYVNSVMLRAQLLGGTPPELLGAITGLTESQFPVHAPRTSATASRRSPRRGRVPQRRSPARRSTRRPARRSSRSRMAKSCRSATRPRSGGSCRCATLTATRTCTRSWAASPLSTRCSIPTSTPP